MIQLINNLLIIISLTNIVSCKTSIEATDVLSITVLDSVAASKEIILEDPDGFFKKLQPLEMQIQMKQPIRFQNKEIALSKFYPYLQAQVSDFTTSDKAFVDTLFNEVRKGLAFVNPNLLPSNINLVKVKTGHYGADVYYTRRNTIYLPENIFIGKNFKKEYDVMLHEVWHIMSRYDSKLKQEAYALIGFKPHDKNLQFDPHFESTLLTNPDGTNMEYAITVGGTQALPLIISKFRDFSLDRPSFFDYLSFDLYPINETGIVSSKALENDTMKEFFTQIKDNTQYIIHPDEIIAENFMLSAKAYKSKKYDLFTDEGRPLIMAMTKLLVGN